GYRPTCRTTSACLAGEARTAAGADSGLPGPLRLAVRRLLVVLLRLLVLVGRRRLHCLLAALRNRAECVRGRRDDPHRRATRVAGGADRRERREHPDRQRDRHADAEAAIPLALRANALGDRSHELAGRLDAPAPKLTLEPALLSLPETAHLLPPLVI